MHQDKPIWHLLLRYLQYSQVIKNYSPYTIRSYKESIKLLLKTTNISTPADLTKPTLEDWFFQGRLERKWSPATFQGYHKHINMFCKWLVKESILEENPAEKIEKPKLEHKIPRTLCKEDAKLVLDTAYHMKYTYKFEKYRNAAIIAIMLYAGLRRGEVIRLKMADVKLYEKSIFIEQSKGHKDRIIPMSTSLYTILERYIKDRNRLNKDSIYFFTGAQSNHPINEKCMDKLMKKLRIKTDLKFSSHTLRHAFARLMLEGGCDIYTLSKLMGHSKITTTTIYLSCSNKQMSKSIEMHSLN